MDSLNAATELYEKQTGFHTPAAEDAQASARRAYIVQRQAYHFRNPTERDIDTRVYEDAHLLTFRREAEISPFTAALNLLQRFHEEERRQAVHDADDANYETIMEAL